LIFDSEVQIEINTLVFGFGDLFEINWILGNNSEYWHLASIAVIQVNIGIALGSPGYLVGIVISTGYFIYQKL
jgi:hypothetical protein